MEYSFLVHRDSPIEIVVAKISFSDMQNRSREESLVAFVSSMKFWRRDHHCGDSFDIDDMVKSLGAKPNNYFKHDHHALSQYLARVGFGNVEVEIWRDRKLGDLTFDNIFST